MIFLLLFLLLVPIVRSTSAGGNEPINVLPDSNKASFRVDSQNFWKNELPMIVGRYFPRDFVVSGGLHSISVSCVAPPTTALEAFTNTGNRITNPPFIIDYTTVGGDCSNDVCWVVGSGSDAATLPGTQFQRAGQSNFYVDCVSSQLTQPADSVSLMKVTLSSGALQNVEDLRRSSSQAIFGEYNVLDFGAKPDNFTDLGPPLQAAINRAAEQQNVVVKIPGGSYALKSPIVIPKGVTIQGDPWVVKYGWVVEDILKSRGTWINISDPSFSPITITASGVAIKDIAFDQEHPTPIAGWTPINYPYIITVGSPTYNIGHLNFRNLFFYKANKGFWFKNNPTLLGVAQFNMDNVWGQFFNVGVNIEMSADVNRFTNIHMYPFWSIDPNVMSYQKQYAYGFNIWRADAPYFENVFIFAVHTGFYFPDNPVGITSGAEGVNIGVDASTRGLVVQQPGATIRFTNFAHYASDIPLSVIGTSAGVTSNGGEVYVVNSDFAGMGTYCAAAGDNGLISLVNVRCLIWNVVNAGHPGIAGFGTGKVSLAGAVQFGAGSGGPTMAGNFMQATLPGGANFDPSGQFYITSSGGLPTLNFAPSTFLQWVPSSNRFILVGPGSGYLTGGATKYLCITDGVLEARATCP